MLQKALNIVAALVMTAFGIQKLMGVEEVIAGFKQLEDFAPIDIDTLRMLTGGIEVSIALLLLAYTFTNKASLGKLGYLMLTGTMLGALTMEFFARPEPMMMMVVIAIALLLLAFYKLKTLIKN